MSNPHRGAAPRVEVYPRGAACVTRVERERCNNVRVVGEFPALRVPFRLWVVRRHPRAAIGRAADPAALVEPEALVAGAEGTIVVEAVRRMVANRRVFVAVVVSRWRECETCVRVHYGRKG